MTEVVPTGALAESGCWSDVAGHPFAVLGLGRSGLAAANALARRGADVQVYDDRSAQACAVAAGKLLPGVRTRFGGGYIARPAEICVISPGIAPHTATYRRAQATATLLVGEVELFYRLNRANNDGLGNPIVAISGTDGKTTTAMMIAHLLQTAGLTPCLAGNIGTPLTEVLDDLPADRWVVAEVSAFQLHTCQLFRPRVSVVTNVADDHHDWFSGDKNVYRDAKRKVFARAAVADTIVYNAEDPAFSTDSMPSPGPALRACSHRTDAFDLGFDGTSLTARVADVAVPFLQRKSLGADGAGVLLGEHNVSNALLAAGAAFACGATWQHIAAGLQTFVAAPHRLQALQAIHGVRFIDDSKATNPHAALAGLRAVTTTPAEKLVWIGGGSEKDADFSALAAQLEKQVDAVVLIGQTADRIAAALPEAVDVHRAASMHDAVSTAFSLAQPAGLVLLSPACASFGMFQSYAHRGQVFAQAVDALAKAVQ